MKHEEGQQWAKIHNERKAKYTVKLTKETKNCEERQKRMRPAGSTDKRDW